MVYSEGSYWYIRITDLLLPWSLSMIYRKIDTKIVTKLEPVCSNMTNPIEKSFKGGLEEYFCGVFRRFILVYSYTRPLLNWSLSIIQREIDAKIVTKLRPVCSNMTHPIEKSFQGRSEGDFCGVFRRLLNRCDDLRSHFKAIEFRARTDFVKSSHDFGISLSKPGSHRLEGFASVSRVRGRSAGVLEVIL